MWLRNSFQSKKMSGEVSNSARQWKMSDEILNLVRLYDFFFAMEVLWYYRGRIFQPRNQQNTESLQITRSATDNLSYQPR